MAKISVSLPDALKERLDAYAKVHDLSVSESVQQALEQFLDGATPPAPPPPPPPAALVDQQVRNFVQDLAVEVEMMRRSMQGALLPVPYPLPPPPWYNPNKAAGWPDPHTLPPPP